MYVVGPEKVSEIQLSRPLSSFNLCIWALLLYAVARVLPSCLAGYPYRAFAVFNGATRVAQYNSIH